MCMYLYMYKYIYIYMHTYMYTYIYIYIYIRITKIPLTSNNTRSSRNNMTKEFKIRLNCTLSSLIEANTCNDIRNIYKIKLDKLLDYALL
jgi:hypothetical protein